ncbi:MAG: PHP domain-containing protein, partial [Chloroflexota bacterium]
MYAELHCHSYFSLLDGASSPESLVARAKELGLRALALTDHDSLAGAIRFWKAARQAELHAIIGAEVTLADDSHLTLLAENQDGYANLCRLLTLAHLQQPTTDDRPTTAISGSSVAVGGQRSAVSAGWLGKGEPKLTWDALAQHHDGLLCLSGCRRGVVAASALRGQVEQATANAVRLRDIFGREQVWVELQHHQLPDDDRLVRGLMQVARPLDLPCVATNNVHYATREASRLRDALIAIRHNQSLTETRRAGLLPLNSNYDLVSPDAMLKKFRDTQYAIRNTLSIAERCHVSLDFSEQRLPAFVAPDGLTEFAYLYQLCHSGLPHRYPHLTPAVLKQLAHELAVIEQAALAGYFLVVWDIVRFAREQGIRCQGRGSAANSLVAYLLGITSVDPLQHNLLFERFLSADRYTTPDIDLDFAADRREEVIQYVYNRYSVVHTAMVCNVVTYQARSAVRDLGKALDFPLPVIDRLSKSLDAHSCARAAEQLLRQVENDVTTEHTESAEKIPRKRPKPVLSEVEASQTPTLNIQRPTTQPPNHPTIQLPNHPLRLLADLVRQIDGCLRHLSIHVGGMLITALPINEIVPLERATMPGRIVCQWDKDSVEDAGLIKID